MILNRTGVLVILLSPLSGSSILRFLAVYGGSLDAGPPWLRSGRINTGNDGKRKKEEITSCIGFYILGGKRRCRYEMERKTVWIGNRLPKGSRMAGVGMPQFYGGK